MSLIGPRPGLPREVLQYDGRAKRRLTVKPGCGGPWQSGGRSDSTFEGMVEYDLWMGITGKSPTGLIGSRVLAALASEMIGFTSGE